jgi:outer membrane protein assembly factor BamD
MRFACLTLLVSLLFAGGCAWLPDVEDETKDWSAQQLYTAAKTALNEGDYEKAIKYFETLEARYPFGRYAQQAELEVAYAYYRFDEPDSAISAADRFIKLHPQHPNVDYAYYLKGLANFNRGDKLILRLFPQDASQRDTNTTRQAYDDFAALVKRFPDSKYAKDASQRMVYLRNNLAMYEIHVADFYMRRGAYIAAANRGKFVIENYQRTPAVPDALVIMARAYDKLGMEDLAEDAVRVLGQNYPDNPALAELSQRNRVRSQSLDHGEDI